MTWITHFSTLTMEIWIICKSDFCLFKHSHPPTVCLVSRKWNEFSCMAKLTTTIIIMKRTQLKIVHTQIHAHYNRTYILHPCADRIECLSSTKLLANGNCCMMLKHDEVHLYFVFDLFEFIVLLIVGLCSVGSVFIHLSHCSNGSVGSTKHSQLDNQN